jgi:hypothetical protein
MDGLFEALGTPAPGATVPAPPSGAVEMQFVRSIAGKYGVEMLPSRS